MEIIELDFGAITIDNASLKQKDIDFMKAYLRK